MNLKKKIIRHIRTIMTLRYFFFSYTCLCISNQMASVAEISFIFMDFVIFEHIIFHLFVRITACEDGKNS